MPVTRRTNLDWGSRTPLSSPLKRAAQGDVGDVATIVRDFEVREDGAVRGVDGRWISPDDMEALDRNLTAAIEAEAERLFGHMNPRLTISETSRYRARLAEGIIPVCQNPACGKPMTRRSGAKTCSNACRMALSRYERKTSAGAGTRLSVRRDTSGCRVGGIRRSAVTPTTKINDLLATYVMAAWDIPLPFEARADTDLAYEWRMSLANDLKDMALMELSRLTPMPERFEKRARAYVEHAAKMIAKDNLRASTQGD